MVFIKMVMVNLDTLCMRFPSAFYLALYLNGDWGFKVEAFAYPKTMCVNPLISLDNVINWTA